jgi:hypothetical protein
MNVQPAVPPIDGQSLTASTEAIEAVKAYIKEHKTGTVGWHITLNNHASKRPDAYGGPTVVAVTDCKTYEKVEPGSASSWWRCSLRLPNSFTPGDGFELFTTGAGSTRTDASNDACHTAMAILLLRDASKVVLRPKHWKVTPDELIAGLPGAQLLAHQALPVHVHPRSLQGAEGAEGDSMSPTERDEAVAQIIERCLISHGGSFDPSKISHRALGLQEGDERMYMRLNLLLHPGELKLFIERHPAFEWQQHDKNRMLITWASSAPGSASVTADAPASASASGSTQPISVVVTEATGSASAPGSASVTYYNKIGRSL